MATESQQIDLSSPNQSVASYIRAWRDDDPEAQWQCLAKVDPDRRLIEHRVTDAISERWDFAVFQEHFPALKSKYHDRYILRRLRTVRMSSTTARVHYAVRRKDSLLRSLPFALSKWMWLTQAAERVFGLYPWYDALSYYDVTLKQSSWLVTDWRYYKY